MLCYEVNICAKGTNTFGKYWIKEIKNIWKKLKEDLAELTFKQSLIPKKLKQNGDGMWVVHIS